MNNAHNTNAFTRGSQLCLHTIRMLGQGTKASVLMGAGLALLWFTWQLLSTIELVDINYLLYYWWAEFKLYIGTIFFPAESIMAGKYNALAYQEWFVSSQFGIRIRIFLGWLYGPALLECGGLFLTGMACCYFYFVQKGRKSITNKKNRGGDLEDKQAIKSRLAKQHKASDIRFNGLPLVKDSERQHILITGTTGTGKTNMLHELLPQIKKRGEKAIIVDLNGSFVGPYFEEGHDHILNPFDARSVKWTPWGDCRATYDYDALAYALVGDGYAHDPFWQDSAKQVLAVALEKFKTSCSLKELLYLLNSASMGMYEQFFKDTFVGSLTTKDADKTVASIRANINQKTKPLSYLSETTHPFSIKDFIKRKDSKWLYITCSPDARETLKPLLTAWISIAIQGIMQQDIAHNVPNTWLIMDELPALGKIPALKTALAEARKYGGCMVAGVQNIHQMMSIYGQNEALNLLDQFNTRFIYRVGDQQTAHIASKMLGEVETTETKESLSYGANTMRDGVNLNHVEKRKSLVMATEIMNLNDLECYAKLAGNYPICKLKLELQKRKVENTVFVENKEMV